jgi:sterol desaturase/sphingolipid hydroxylase (fatty acid hydroxylase superfamily)
LAQSFCIYSYALPHFCLGCLFSSALDERKIGVAQNSRAFPQARRLQTRRWAIHLAPSSYLGSQACSSTSIKDSTLIYRNFDDYPLWWFFLSIPAALVIHDAYFYWTHRIMHHPSLFKTMHLVHHKSTNPTPWASFAFHPLESVVESSIIIVLVFAIPMHPLAILSFLLIMTAENVMGHLGYEFYPRWLTQSFVGKWLNTSTNHNMHHRYFEGNYGLYFRWWDVWMGTTHAKYDATLLEIQARKPVPQASTEATMSGSVQA